MGDATEITFIQHSSSECEVNPLICSLLSDENTAEDKIVIPAYQAIKNVVTFDILSPTGLTYVPSFILNRFPNVQFLRLTNTGITNLKTESFVNGHKLEELDLRHNQIANVPSKIFANLDRLETIHLAYNRIARLGHNAFVDLPALKILFLSNNQLQTVDSGHISAVNLTELYLDSNAIRLVAANALDLPKLEIISLKDNRLRSLPDTVFKNSPRLEKIDLSNNDLIKIDGLFGKCANVYSLNLSDNPELHADLFQLTEQLPELSYLHLANTGVKLPSDIQTNHQLTTDESNLALTHLDLSTNNLSSPDIFLYLATFKRLKTVILNNNLFSHLNHVLELKTMFPRLATIQFKHIRNFELSQLKQLHLLLKNQHIALVSEHQFNE